MTIRTIVRWLDDHLLLILASFLLAFIPLYPKIPLSIGGQLVELLPGYIVRVRLEDVFILLTVLVWFIQVLRKKVSWKTPLTFGIILYIIVGLLANISGVLLTKTIPPELLHIGKSMLHLFRYIEYFSLLFITYASIKSVKHLKIVLAIISITIVVISIYGYGQRSWYWPVYSTMNREFSKGVRLYLTEHARVQSTFGGHYDLAAYLVITLPLLLAASFLSKNKWIKFLFWLVFLGAYWLMMATASRTSYAAFFVAIGITIPLSAYLVRKLWKDKIIWAIKEYFLFGFISLIMLTAFGGSMYERLLQTLEAYPSVHSGYLFTVTKVSDASEIALEFVIPGKQEDAINDFYEKFLGKKSEPPENGLSLEEAAVLVSSDTQPTTAEDSTPSDVYVNVPVYETVATVSAEGVTSEILVERDRTYSENAQKYGLSMAIRLDTLWPRALEGFYSNPAFGSGYATLTKETYGQFTEAESTDNNFLRTLGETGALGFILFYGIIVLTTIIAFRLLKNSKLDSTAAIFVIAFIGGTVGLLLNALFIDVFAASKVALMYWALAGIVLAIQSMYGEEYFKFDFINRYFSQKDNTVEKVSS
ncbi:MAG: hypothetical protein QG639_782 [Patescibacteria group bacterium]|nr:hypothetical protein [Patescibacteria group bacterium]